MLQPGQEFAHFKIISELGTGGMGAVYLAEDQKLHREVALKILLTEYFDDAERLGRFQREAKTAAQISHPNVMAIYDIGEAKDPASDRMLQYIVMERVRGIPLGEYFQTKSPEIGGVIRIAQRIASGLSAAHKLNIAHRDIKSSNILVDDDGQPKILDFGLAKPIDPVQLEEDGTSTDTVSQELTRAGKIVGTVSYMSPEQARGEQIDTRTDIFSFGVLLYRMATGEFPFAGKSQVSTLAKILEARHESPRVKNETVPAELERIIDKCLQKDPADRYQSAADLVVDLRNLRRQFDSGVTESISTERTRVKTFSVSGKKLGLAVLGVIALSIIAGVVMNIVDNPTSEADLGGEEGTATQAAAPVYKNALAIFNFENKTGDSTLNWLQTGLPEILMTDLTQSGAITVISRDRVVDHIRATGGMSEEIEKELEATSRELQQMIAEGDWEGLPGVKEAIRAARAGMAGAPGELSQASMLDAAKSLGASNVLTGSFFRMGDKIRIDARLEDINTGRIVLAEKVVGEDPFNLVDSLTSKIAASLDVSVQLAKRGGVGEMITDSEEAYRVYHEGMKYFALELYDKAIEEFEAATRIDPEFALAYMRIGMAHLFDGRMQKGTQFFALANEYRDGLPPKERSLLDIYSDLWLNQDFDAAFVKLRSFVDNYPGEWEGRAFYGLASWVFEKDTANLRNQYDSVLALDPTNQLVLSWYGDFMAQIDKPDSAIYYYRKVRSNHPESPTGYVKLAGTFREEGQLQRAAEEYMLVTELFPEEASAWLNLVSIAIEQRQFERAETYLERYRDNFGDDPYRMNTYYYHRANLANWKGQFRNAIKYTHDALGQAILTGDSGLVRQRYNMLYNYYELLGMKDSLRWAADRNMEWSSGFNRIDAVLKYASLSPEACDSVRPVFDEIARDFRERMPAGIWPLIDSIEVLYDAQCASDSARMADALVGLANAQQPGQGSGNLRSAAIIKARIGRYREALEGLQPYLTGEEQTSSGFIYPLVLYYVGVSEHELGDNDDAIAHLQEMLHYWGNADIEFPELKDARRRLDQLTS